MSDLNDWANLAADNDRTPVPDYMPEGATPVPMFNNWGREAQAATRRFFETLEWRNFLSDSESPTFASATTFTVPVGKASLYVAGMRIRITDTGFAVNPGYGEITDVTSNTITVVMDDAGNNITAAISLVEVGFSPVGEPISHLHIHNFDGEVITVVDDNGTFQRKLYSAAISITYVSATTFTVAAADKNAFWALARLDINGATPVQCTVTSITPGADPDVDPATVVVVVDGAGVIGADATTATHVAIAKDEGTVLDVNGQIRGTGYPVALIGYEEVNLGTLVSAGSNTTHTLGAVPFLYAVVAKVKAAVNGHAIGDEILLASWTADKDSGSGGNRSDYGVTVWVDATKVYCRSSGSNARIRSSDNTQVTLDGNTNYDIVFKLITLATLSTP